MLLLTLRSKIYFITPEPPPPTPELRALVRAALKAGVGMVQYRAKSLTTAQMVAQVQELLTLTRPVNVPLIVNDRVDIALAAGAEGVHVGREDMLAALARRVMGPRALVGVSCDTVAQAMQAEREAASYVAFGPIFPSPVKPDVPAIGLAPLLEARTRVSLPLCAIGGITAQNLAQLAPVNPELVAVISAISGAPDPGAAARELVELAAQQLPHRTRGA